MTHSILGSSRNFGLPLLVLAFSATAHAQACLGLPQRSSFAYERGKLTIGNTNGATGTLSGGPVSFTLGAATRSISPDLSGWQANLGFAVVISISKLKLCPGIGLLYQHDSWDVNTTTTLTSHSLEAKGGLSAGIEQEVYKGFSVIPYVGMNYRFNAILFDLQATNATTSVTGDTISGVNLDYGVMGHYRFVYGGIGLSRLTKRKTIHPDMARYVIGVTLGNTEKKAGAGK